ncbi:MAG: hypothetical protein AB7I30_09510 [Isosphaeraceae bacterium]
MRRLLAALITLGLMALLVWSGSRRVPEDSSQAAVSTPVPSPAIVNETHPAEARIQALLESARIGDVSAYLDAFSGPLRERLERQVTERGKDAFAEELRQASTARKSHATFAAEEEGPADALVTVEAVYPDRNERQTYRLERAGPEAVWRVTDVARIRSVTPSAKFGAPATYQAPEAVPVPRAGLTIETGEDSLP